MSEQVLVIIESSGIQDYVFGSNRLRENIGASYLVKAIIEDWIVPDDYAQGNRQAVGHPDVEILWYGGGNIRLRCANAAAAEAFTRAWSLRLLRKAPGLRAIVTHQPYVENDLTRTHSDAMQAAARNRSTQPLAVPALGLSVTADCQSTGLPASAFNRRGDTHAPELYPVSRAVQMKLAQLEAANKHLKDEFRSPTGYEYPLDFDDLGRTVDESADADTRLDNHSYLAVVHIDGNGMGERFRKLQAASIDDTDYVAKMRKLSEAVRSASKAALQHCIDLLVARISTDGKEVFFTATDNSSFKLKRNPKNQSFYLPFRPLIYGGDDVTFVCDGRIGLALAAAFLEKFSERQPDGEQFTACAGVAIVKTHYPFARAYALAEELCANAKQFVSAHDNDGCAIDWHIAPSGLSGSLETIREREYTKPAQADQSNTSKDSPQPRQLYLRPVWVGAEATTFQRWQTITMLVNELKGRDWGDKRNKVMLLREVLRQGADKVKEFETIYGVKLSKPFDEPTVDETELHQAYFDAIELLEFLFELKEDATNANVSAPH